MLINLIFFKSFGRFTEELQKQLSEEYIEHNLIKDNNHFSDLEITDAINVLENAYAYLYSIEGLIERIFDIEVSENIES